VSLNVLADLLLALVPNFEPFVVTHARELMQVEVVPGDILDYLRVRVPLAQGVNRGRKLVGLINVPQADFIVVAAAEKQAQLLRVPLKPVPFLTMAEQP